MSVSQLSEFSSSAEYIRDCQVCDRLLDFIISTLHTILYKNMGMKSGTVPLEPGFPSDKDRFTDFNEPYFGVDIAYFVPAVELSTD